MRLASNSPGNPPTYRVWQEARFDMRGILLWALGIPIPIIILLYLFDII